jgi:hypothetical protein
MRAPPAACCTQISIAIVAFWLPHGLLVGDYMVSCAQFSCRGSRRLDRTEGLACTAVLVGWMLVAEVSWAARGMCVGRCS